MNKRISISERIDSFFKSNLDYTCIKLDKENKVLTYKHNTCNTVITRKFSRLYYAMECNNRSCVLERTKNTNLKKYGVENPFQSEEIKDKIKEKLLTIYNVDHPSKSNEIKQKIKNSHIERYGKFNNNREKCKETTLKKYGVENVGQVEEVKNKIKETTKKNFNVECSFQSEEIKKKCKKTKLERYNDENYRNKEKREQTCIERYGVKNVTQNKEILEKATKTQYKKFFIEKIKYFELVKPLFDINEYEGVKDKNYKWLCLKCNKEFYDTIDNGTLPRCLDCFPKDYNSSKGENELADWLSSVINIEKHKRFKTDKQEYELDIFVPSKNIGIEYNGIYWHSELSGEKNKYYHLNKSKFFESNNIQLIHVFENEWIEKPNIIKSIVLSKLGLLTNKIYARNCILKLYKNSDNNLKDFFENNHLQGFVKNKNNVYICLEHNNEIVLGLIFGKSRYNLNYEYELIRYASKSFYSVIGGFSKCLKYFVNNYSKSIITYADKRYSVGNLYLNNNFQFIENTKPNYFYTKNHLYLESRIKYQKHKLKKLFDNYNENLTEWQNMQINKYDRIWDCGNMVFKYNS